LIPTKQSRVLPKAPSKPQALALYDFDAREANELSFKSGDVVTVLSQDGEWWTAELHGHTGTVPSNYMQLRPQTAL